MPELSVEETPLVGLLVVRPEVHRDDRGFFLEPYRVERYAAHGIALDAQDNHSRSTCGVLRGLHFQTDPGQAKLIRCARGQIFDVAVDVRLDSPTYGEWFGMELDDVEHAQVYVPIGFAHGFCVLSDVADVTYKVSSPYDPATEAGIAWDDPDLAIDWKVADPVVSARDDGAPRLVDVDWSSTVWQAPRPSEPRDL
jgi:dTDP-4-dehydrorhamnose 3,5-epimerase